MDEELVDLDGVDESWEEDGWQEEPTDRPRAAWWWGWLAFVLSLAGFADALYLTIDHFRGIIPICSSTGIVDCAKVTTSPQSEVFGIFPVALLGLLFFTAMVGINVPALWHLTGKWGLAVAWARLAMAVTGIGFVFYLVYSELFTIKAICLWCTGVHIVTFLLFVLVMATFPTMVSQSEVESGW